MSKPNNLRIYHQDEDIVVIDKPSGFQVHTPVAYAMQGKVVRKNNVLILLRKQLEREIFTVHRLDKATSGVMVFSLSSDGARLLQDQFISKSVKKTYVCLVRGWTADSGVIDKPLSKNLVDGTLLDSVTEYETLHRFEIPYSTGRYEKERYSILKVHPLTGRLHQIRRHFRSISHPLVGDTVHGDGKHNRLWRELIGGSGPMANHLFLKSYSIEFNHPKSLERMKFKTRWNKPWMKLFEIAGLCLMIDS
jgi:tRNA pseudouridine65 synthase